MQCLKARGGVCRAAAVGARGVWCTCEPVRPSPAASDAGRCSVPRQACSQVRQGLQAPTQAPPASLRDPCVLQLCARCKPPPPTVHAQPSPAAPAVPGWRPLLGSHQPREREPLAGGGAPHAHVLDLQGLLWLRQRGGGSPFSIGADVHVHQSVACGSRDSMQAKGLRKPSCLLVLLVASRPWVRLLAGMLV